MRKRIEFSILVLLCLFLVRSGFGQERKEISSAQELFLDKAGQRFFVVDIRKYCNMGFRDEVADDKKGGWTDQGEHDMRNLPTGLQEFNGIPFKIINPDDDNEGRSCIVLRANGHHEYFPQRVDGISIGKSGIFKIHFLHVNAWEGPVGEPLAKYRVHYSDDSKDSYQDEIPLIEGINTANWGGHREGHDLENAKIAWMGKAPSGISCWVYQFAWENPHPFKTIESIDFITAETMAIPILIAITLEKGNWASPKEQYQKCLEIIFHLKEIGKMIEKLDRKMDLCKGGIIAGWKVKGLEKIMRDKMAVRDSLRRKLGELKEQIEKKKNQGITDSGVKFDIEEREVAGLEKEVEKSLDIETFRDYIEIMLGEVSKILNSIIVEEGRNHEENRVD